MTVLVVGSRGAVGRGVLAGLLRDGVAPGAIRAAGRDPQRLAVPEGVGTVALDLGDAATHAGALDGVDAVFAYAGDGIEAFAGTARAAGVDHVVVLSSAAVAGADPATDMLSARHLGAERAFRDAGLPTTALRPGAFCGNALGWAPSVRTDGVVTLPFPGATTAPIHEADIADVAVAALTAGAARGEDVELSGPESMTFTEQVGVLARETGLDVAARPVDPDTVRARMLRSMPEGLVDSLFRFWRATDGVPTPVTDAVERLTGHPARPFAQWVREHRADFDPEASV